MAEAYLVQFGTLQCFHQQFIAVFTENRQCFVFTRHGKQRHRRGPSLATTRTAAIVVRPNTIQYPLRVFPLHHRFPCCLIIVDQNRALARPYGQQRGTRSSRGSRTRRSRPGQSGEQLFGAEIDLLDLLRLAVPQENVRTFVGDHREQIAVRVPLEGDAIADRKKSEEVSGTSAPNSPENLPEQIDLVDQLSLTIVNGHGRFVRGRRQVLALFTLPPEVDIILLAAVNGEDSFHGFLAFLEIPEILEESKQNAHIQIHNSLTNKPCFRTHVAMVTLH